MSYYITCEIGVNGNFENDELMVIIHDDFFLSKRNIAFFLKLYFIE